MPIAGSPADSAIRVKQLTKKYGRLTALSAVAFSIRRGEVLGLIGPNGSGKTTLFECMGGVLPFEGGAIAGPERSLTRHDLALTFFYLPDAIAPWPAQTVGWALDFTLGFFGGPKDLREDVVNRLDLAPLLGSPIGTLSKGQRKRALLGLGLLTPHPILLADEPFDGLDLRQTREIGRALRSYAARGRTLVLSIHQISDAARVCDRFVLLSGGSVVGEGTLDELTSLAEARDNAASHDGLEEVFLALT
jgi:ABC-2 type transport system ATP-binding protein